jgi:hypothetical protein
MPQNFITKTGVNRYEYFEQDGDKSCQCPYLCSPNKRFEYQRLIYTPQTTAVMLHTYEKEQS